MDFVNQAIAQLTDGFRQMSPGTRIVSALLLVAVVISLFYLTQYQGTAGNDFLLNGRSFSAAELTTIEASFAKAGLGLSVVEGNRIRIPSGQKHLYLAAMADADALPRDFEKFMDEANAVDNPFVSSRAHELKQKHAKQKELGLIISRMRGLQSATVQFDEVESDRFRREKQKTAMVAVQTVSGTIDADQVKAIRNIVASSYAGLDRSHITITDIASGISFSATDGSGQSPEESIYASHKDKFERDWRQKIQQQLSMIPNVVVGINVELNPEIDRRSLKTNVDAKPVAIQSSESTKESTTTQPANAGRPGAVPNGVGNQPVSLANATQAPGPSSTNSESKSDVRNIAGHEQVSFQLAPLVPTKVSASIDIPKSYYTKVWREQQPPGAATKEPDAAELDKIETATVARVRETVRNLLPQVATGTDPYPYIVVSSYTDLPSAPLAAPSIADTSMLWVAAHWQTIALVVLGLFALLTVRNLAKGAMAPPPASEAAEASGSSSGSTAAPGEEEADEPEVAHVLKRKLGSDSPNLKEELAGLVKDDPDAAATILRAWIGDAA